MSTHLNEEHTPLLFASPKWVSGALTRKLRGSPKTPGEPVSGVMDYLCLSKLRKRLWKPVKPDTTVIWMDPPDWKEEGPGE